MQQRTVRLVLSIALQAAIIRAFITINNNKGKVELVSCLKSSITNVNNYFENYDNESDNSGQLIYLIDDEEPILNAVSAYLESEGGYQTLTFQSASNALSHLVLDQKKANTLTNNNNNSVVLSGKTILPDAIVSDIRMPDMDGLTFLQIIRQNPRLKRIPVILLTARGMIEDRIAGYGTGADAYITKPFQPEELLVILMRVIKRRKELDMNTVTTTELAQEVAEVRALLEVTMRSQGGAPKDISDVRLTAREEEILEFLCKGLTNKEIAIKTHLSHNGVAKNINQIRKKTNVRNRTELVNWALSNGVVDTSKPYFT